MEEKLMASRDLPWWETWASWWLALWVSAGQSWSHHVAEDAGSDARHTLETSLAFHQLYKKVCKIFLIIMAGNNKKCPKKSNKRRKTNGSQKSQGSDFCY